MRVFIALFTLLATACGQEPRTQVMVFVRAEPGVMARTTRLDVDVLAGAPGEALDLRETVTYTSASESAFFPLRWPRQIALVPQDDDASRQFAVVARVADDDGDFARAEVASSYLRGETLTLDVWLRDACIDQSCGADMTCERGACVATTPVDPCSLRRLEDDQVPEGCSPAADAGLDASVTEDAGPVDAGTVDAGVILDAGPSDAGPNDAGAVDAGPPDAGPIDGGPPGPLDLYNVVFVTSTPRAPGSYGDIDGAHAHCQALALAEGLPEPASYRAFLSTTSSAAIDLLTGSRGWVRPDGLPFADQPADIVAGHTYYPVALTESGAPPSETLVATGTRADLSTGATCGDWGEETGNVTAGNAFDGPRFWLERTFGLAPTPAPTLCSAPHSLYCFGTGRSVALEAPTPEAGAGGVFITSSTVDSGGGIAALDAACQLEGGSDYVAFVPEDGTSTALSRLSGFGGPWVRPDGVVVARTVGDLAAEMLRAPPTQDAFGVYVPNERFWSPEVPPSTMGGLTCGGWSATSGGGARFSYAGRVHRFYSAAISRSCGGVGDRVLCLSTAAVH